MNIFSALIFGFVQGLTEFLPISSSGHILLLGTLFNLNEQTIFTAVLLHLATFFSVCVVLKKEIIYLLKNPFSKQAKKLFFASAVTFVIVLFFKKTVEKSFQNLLILPWCFLISAILLVLSELYSKNLFKNKPLNNKHAIIIGAVQGIATLPGISRSGSTISAALFCGVSKEEATNFSFLLSLPIILASAVSELIGVKSTQLQNFAFLPNLLAFIISFVVGIFAIKLMQQLLKRARMWWFSVYLAVVAIIIFLC